MARRREQIVFGLGQQIAQQKSGFKDAASGNHRDDNESFLHEFIAFSTVPRRSARYLDTGLHFNARPFLQQRERSGVVEILMPLFGREVVDLLHRFQSG